MKKEDKELLLKDLCARLPYGVYAKVPNHISIDPLRIYSIKQIYKSNFDLRKNTWICCFWNGTFAKIDEIKPYLRPMSSMTEEESKELQKITNNNFYASSNYISNSNSSLDGEWRASYNNFVTNDICNKLISWLDKSHFDHRTDEEGKTLIEKGLAIPVTKESNQYK